MPIFAPANEVLEALIIKKSSLKEKISQKPSWILNKV